MSNSNGLLKSLTYEEMEDISYKKSLEVIQH